MRTIDTATCLAIQDTMGKEIKRAMKGFQVKGHPKTYFISTLLRAQDDLYMWGRYGTIFHSGLRHDSDLYSEVRVGSYQLDQMVDGGITTDLSTRTSYEWSSGPEELSPDAIRYALWRNMQYKHQEAISDYYDKKKILLEQHLDQKVTSFTKEEPQINNVELEPLLYQRDEWEGFVRESSDHFRRHKSLLDPYVSLQVFRTVRVYVNSEGSRFIEESRFYQVIVYGCYLTKEGVYLNARRRFYGRLEEALPSIAQVRAAIDEVAADLRSLARSKPMEPYAGPALLSGRASGLLFHEAIGHRLEGERMTSRSEGHTYAEKIGKRILPEGVDIIDDPSLTHWDGQVLYGNYEMDDEGVSARPVTLVKDGILKTFLLSRSGVKGFRKSNGHGRQQRFQAPMARMANLIISAKEDHSWEELKDMLCRRVRERKLPYGIMIKDASSGETSTSGYTFQGFKGHPTEVYQVDAKSGKERRVRDVSFIGTPLAATQRIITFGRDVVVDNGFCSAESGTIPVSTIAPSMLVEELELQRSTTNFYKPPTLRFPPIK